MSLKKILLTFFLLALPFQVVRAQGSDFSELKCFKEMTKDSLSFNGFVFERKIADADVRILVKYHGRSLIEYNGYPGVDNDETRALNTVKLYKMLSGKNYQALVFCSDGGKEKTGVYTILNLGSEGTISKLFDSDAYSLMGWYKVLEANNGEGALIVDYCAPLSDLEGSEHMFMSKIQAEKVFGFDKKMNAYEPSPDDAWALLQSDIIIAAHNVERNDLKSILRLSLIYWFSGKEKDGWAVFNRSYNLGDKGELTEKIRKLLSNDKYIKMLNR